MGDRDGDCDNTEAHPPEISVSEFDFSVENHFKAMDEISKLSGESEVHDDQIEIQQLFSSITFLREWRHFCYQPRAIRFASQSETPQKKDVIDGIHLPQFSSAAVPKMDVADGNKVSSQLSKDFVMYVGGLVWGLDWCPRVHQSHDSEINVEFIAVAVHPPESLYHKVGAPLTGRGVIQIWCLLNAGVKDQDAIPRVKKKPKKYSTSNELKTTQPKKPRGRPRKYPIDKSSVPHKPRGRPKKKPLNESVDNSDGGNYHQQLLANCPEDTSKMNKSFLSKEDFCRETNVSEGDLTEQQQHSSGIEAINSNWIVPYKPTGNLRKKMKESVDNSDGGNQYPIDKSSVPHKPRGRPRKYPIDKSSVPHKPRGRPKKKPLNESVDNSDGGNYHQQLLANCPEDTSKMNKSFLSREDFCRETNVSEGDLTEQQQHSSVIETINSNWIVPYKPTGNLRKKMKESVDNSDGGNQYPQPHVVELPVKCNPVEPVKPNKRSKKRRIKEPISKLDNDNQYLEPLAIELPQDSSKLLSVGEVSFETSKIVAEEDNCRNHSGLGAGVSPGHQKQHLTEYSSKMLPEDGISCKTQEQVVKQDSSRKRKVDDKGYTEKSVLTASKSRLTKCQTRVKNQVNGTDLPLLSQNGDETALPNSETLSVLTNRHSISEDVALPRLVMCLAHNGKVAWDVKWRPSDSYSNSKHRMGYLSVLLGNGALEVWEVPLPHATKAIFSACQKEGTDPRFMKLEPVFRCSMLKCGDRQSIPLTVEWSTSSPHDLILAGCHDGLVALWKFSANGPSKDTRPLLCFSADTVPIRALAWAPIASDPESANIIVTGGHKGAKFWDLRDPFHPLWSINNAQKMIYGLDWLPDPRCVVLCYDDGEIRMISLLKAACDTPITGTPFVCSPQQGLYSYYCSSSSIWSVQVSRVTGMVAYCCSDGTVLRFQLTTKAVEKDPRRNREPHYLCGSLTLEESILTVFSPLPDIPFRMKKSSNEWADKPRSKRGFVSSSNQEKRAKKLMENFATPEEQGQALCYGNDPRNESGSDDTLAVENSKQTSKTKNDITENKETDTNLALVCIDEALDAYKSEEESVKKCLKNDDEKETFPPKMVAIHRVRWNMNKGSERWMCYGGAAGIVRCQEIKP